MGVGFGPMGQQSSCPGRGHMEGLLSVAYPPTSPGSLRLDPFVHKGLMSSQLNRRGEAVLGTPCLCDVSKDHQALLTKERGLDQR